MKSKTVADKVGIKLKIVDILISRLLKLRLARESCTSRFCKLDDSSLKNKQNSGTIPIKIPTSRGHNCETNIIVTNNHQTLGSTNFMKGIVYICIMNWALFTV
jgi:hypothetical protein